MIDFLQTLGNGILKGVKQFIDNDLQSYVPLFIIAAVFLVVSQIKNLIQKYKSK